MTEERTLVDGSIIQKPRGSGRWYPVTRHRQPDGGYKQQWHGGFATKRDAKAALNEIVNRINRGNHVEPSRMTMRTYLTGDWLPTIESAVRPTTFDSYRKNVDWHILPTLGDVKLQALTAGQLNALYSQLLVSGRRDGNGGLAVKTVRYIHGIIRTSLRDAADAGHVVQNVAAKAKPPKLRSVKAPKLSTWTAADLRAFFESVRNDRLFAAWRLIAQTGMRRGEVLGVRWENVDFETARLSVRDTLLNVNYRVISGDAKTQKGVRVIDLDAVTLAVLRSHKRRQSEERLAWGEGWNNDGRVFGREDGSPIHPDLFSQMFRRHAKKAKLPAIRLHDLRHTHATLLLKAGVPIKVISERLGHADVAFTMNTYAHAMPGMQAEAAAQIAAIVDGIVR